MAFKASARRHVRLQSAGAGRARAREGRFRVRREKRPFRPSCLRSGAREKMRGDPGSSEPRVLSGQPVEAQDRFQSFEGYRFASERDRARRAFAAGRQGVERGDQDHVPGAFKVRGSTSRWSLRRCGGDIAGALGVVGRLGGDDEAHRQRLEAATRLVDRNRDVDMTQHVGLGEGIEPINRFFAPSRRFTVPRQSNEQIGAAVANARIALGWG